MQIDWSTTRADCVEDVAIDSLLELHLREEDLAVDNWVVLEELQLARGLLRRFLAHVEKTSARRRHHLEQHLSLFLGHLGAVCL